MMKHPALRSLLIITLLFLSFVGCERDDLCTDVPITPLLIITFEDEDNFSTRMTVPNLQITSIKNNRTIFIEPSTTDSIAIPLDIAADNTRFIFTRNTGDVNTDNTSSDTLTFSYLRDNVYVNRACGFRTTYSDISVNRETNNWIKNSEITNPDLNDQFNAHISLSF